MQPVEWRVQVDLQTIYYDIFWNFQSSWYNHYVVARTQTIKHQYLLSEFVYMSYRNSVSNLYAKFCILCILFGCKVDIRDFFFRFRVGKGGGGGGLKKEKEKKL